MRRPLTFAWRNVVFARDVRDPWGLYRLHVTSYPGLPRSGKVELLSRLAAYAAASEADFQILRLSRGWSGTDYAEAARATLDSEHGQTAWLDHLVDQHLGAIESDGFRRPEVFLSVRLANQEGPSSFIADAVRSVAEGLGFSDARGITKRALGEVLQREARAFARLGDYLDAERVSSRELQWIIRRAFCRGAAEEPWLDEFWRPQAVVLDADDEDGGQRFAPLEADVLRLADEPLRIRRDHLELDTGVQTGLVLGALPEATRFPGHHAELMFAPLEVLPFPVDACLSVRWVANGSALALVRRRIVDADHAFSEESQGDHGPTAQTSLRPELARELEEELTAPDRPPLLRGQLSLAVGAQTLDDLEDRVRRIRREYAPISVHRPKDVQLDLWLQHLPAQAARLHRYDDVFLPDQVGAMVPTATHSVGALTGLLIGTTISGAPQPVFFDVTEGSRTSRPPAILCTGTLGSGKTLTAELLALHAFVGGSRVVDLDPKGDHQLRTVIGDGLVEHIELTAGGADRGMLDPLRIAPENLRVELAHSFLMDVLPAPVPAQWQTEVRAAVSEVVAAGGRSTGLVLDELEMGGEDARAAARAIHVHAESGLLQLGFASREAAPPVAGERPVISLRIANLTLPVPGTPRADLTHEERTGRALLRLLAVQALHLVAEDWSRHKVLIVEEASQLICDAVGLALVQRIVRLCRSQNTTPVLVTQMVDDVVAIADLVGCFFAFGVETDAEAGRVLELLGLDASDQSLRARLRGFRRGRCLLRDYDGRVGAVQVNLVDDDLLAALDTTPGARRM
jgi:AAA-like domain